MKILMVCLGNICRSPLAQGILMHKVAQAGLSWQVSSAGTSAWHVGNPPDPRAVAIAHKHGLDISQQRARQFTPTDFATYDIIYAMDSSNYRNIVKQTKEVAYKAKVRIIRNEVQPKFNQAIPDPYWNDKGFEQVYCLLEEACNKIIEKYV